MSRKTSLDKVLEEHRQQHRGWTLSQWTETTWGESYTVLAFLDADALVRAVESFQTLVLSQETNERYGLWSEQRKIEGIRVGFAVRFKDNGAIDGIVELRPDIDCTYVNQEDDEDTRQIYVYGVQGTGGFYKPESRKLSDAINWLNTWSPVARVRREEAAAESARKAEEEVAAYQREKEFILDTRVGKQIAVGLLAELASEKRKVADAIKSLQGNLSSALEKLEKDAVLSNWERLNRQALDEYWEAVHRYNLLNVIVHRHPLGDLTETKYAQDEEARYRHGGEYRVW